MEETIIPEVIESEKLEEDLEQEIQDLVAPQSDEVLLESNTIEVGTVEELETALKTITNGSTIKLLNNIDYNKGILIDGETVTFDVDSFTLNVTNALAGNTHGVGLEVENGGHVNLVGTGQFNVNASSETGSSDGVVVRENSSAMVTNVNSSSGTGNGVYASGDGAVIQVLGNIEAKGSSSCGARTWGSGSITIDGTVTKGGYYVYIHMGSLLEYGGVPDRDTVGGSCGAYATTGGNVSVTGDAKSIGNPNGIGVNSHGGMITIGGNVEGHRYGVSAETRGTYKPTIKIVGSVTGGKYGIHSVGTDCTVEVVGKIETTSVNDWESAILVTDHGKVLAHGNIIAKNAIGVNCYSGGEIKIDGTIIAKTYIKLGENFKGINDYNRIEEGYRIYSDDSDTVLVKDSGDDRTPPEWPNDSTITAVDISSTTLNLIWPEAEENVGVDKYLIYIVTYTEGAEEKTLIGEVRSDDDREFRAKDLDPDTEYRIRITAVDRAENVSADSLEKVFKTKKAFTVNFDSQGGTLVNNQIITEGERVINPITTRTGFTFGGWFKDSECLNPWNFDTDTITGDVTLYAKWIKGEIKQPATPVITTNLPATNQLLKVKL